MIPLLLCQGALWCWDYIKELLQGGTQKNAQFRWKSGSKTSSSVVILNWFLNSVEIMECKTTEVNKCQPTRHPTGTNTGESARLRWTGVTTSHRDYVTILTEVEEPSMVLGDRIIPAREWRSVSKRELFSFVLSWRHEHKFSVNVKLVIQLFLH